MSLRTSASGFELLPGVPDPGRKCAEGTERVVPPEETLRKVLPLLPSMGITRVANVTGLDRIGIPVVVVSRPNSRALAVSQGKGTTLEAAKCSGIMESVESFHAERIDRGLVYASYEEMSQSRDVVDVERLPRLASSSFRPDLPLLWIEGFDLLNREPRWVPYEVVHSDYRVPFPAGSGCFIASSNGLASGNHPLEAVSHGLTEVIERDAYSLWTLAGGDRLEGTRVDLDTVRDPVCLSVLERYEAAGVAVAAWEMTSDIGMPSFSCRIAERRADPFQRLYVAGGMGAHLRPEIALSRALTEAAQSRLTAIAGSRDDISREDFDRYRGSSTIEDQMERMAPPPGTSRPFPSGRGLNETFAEDVSAQLGLLQRAGIEEVVVVDLTMARFALPVVRVVVPGLENALAAEGSEYLLGARARRGAPPAGAGEASADAPAPGDGWS
jgi:YcaO-like protein with predicted kinase domain